MANEISYRLMQITMERLEFLRKEDIEKHGTELYGVPAYFARYPEGGIETYPLFQVTDGRLDDNGAASVFWTPAPKAAARVADAFDESIRQELQDALAGVAAAQRKEHPAQTVRDLIGDLADQTAPTLIGVLQDPIVSMLEFKGRLWVATTKGVFVKRENEDGFDSVELIPAAPATSHFWGKSIDEGRAADEAAGLVPLPDNQKVDRADPFIPNRFGEHG